MAKGTNKIEGLSHAEYQAAIAAVKLIRGDTIKNAYLEGYRDGMEEMNRHHRNEKVDYNNYGWDVSHAKSLINNHP